MPVRSGGRVILSRAWAMLVAQDLVSLPMAPPLDSPELHLMGAAGFAPSPDTLTADLTAVEAGFSGYAFATPSSFGPVTFGTSQVGLVFDNLWVASATIPFIPDTVTGWWLQVGSDWALAAFFVSPGAVAIAQSGDWLALDAAVPLSLALDVVG
jgi:hypothetical protein